MMKSIDINNDKYHRYYPDALYRQSGY